jgi:enamine deaminase RidA (YjgF/YER057c/UK114 family)
MIRKNCGSHWTHDVSGSWTVLARGGASADIVPNVDSDAGGRAEDDAMGVPQVRRFSSGTTWEPVVGYSRAVAAGDFVFVSGCTSVAGAEFVHPGDAYAQARQAIGNAADALTGLGASLADVVQTRMYVTDISRWQEYGRAHGDVFGAIRPASTMIEVAALIEPEMLIEVEVVAYKPGIGRKGDQ